MTGEIHKSAEMIRYPISRLAGGGDANSQLLPAQSRGGGTEGTHTVFEEDCETGGAVGPQQVERNMSAGAQSLGDHTRDGTVFSGDESSLDDVPWPQVHVHGGESHTSAPDVPPRRNVLSEEWLSDLPVNTTSPYEDVPLTFDTSVLAVPEHGGDSGQAGMTEPAVISAAR